MLKEGQKEGCEKWMMKWILLSSRRRSVSGNEWESEEWEVEREKEKTVRFPLNSSKRPKSSRLAWFIGRVLRGKRTKDSRIDLYSCHGEHACLWNRFMPEPRRGATEYAGAITAYLLVIHSCPIRKLFANIHSQRDFWVKMPRGMTIPLIISMLFVVFVAQEILSVTAFG